LDASKADAAMLQERAQLLQALEKSPGSQVILDKLRKNDEAVSATVLSEPKAGRVLERAARAEAQAARSRAGEVAGALWSGIQSSEALSAQAMVARLDCTHVTDARAHIPVMQVLARLVQHEGPAAAVRYYTTAALVIIMEDNGPLVHHQEDWLRLVQKHVDSTQDIATMIISRFLHTQRSNVAVWSSLQGIEKETTMEQGKNPKFGVSFNLEVSGHITLSRDPNPKVPNPYLISQQVTTGSKTTSAQAAALSCYLKGPFLTELNTEWLLKVRASNERLSQGEGGGNALELEIPAEARGGCGVHTGETTTERRGALQALVTHGLLEKLLSPALSAALVPNQEDEEMVRAEVDKVDINNDGWVMRNEFVTIMVFLNLLTEEEAQEESVNIPPQGLLKDLTLTLTLTLTRSTSHRRVS